MLNLLNKNILITGATGGIGKSIAIKCSNQDANVIITGRDIEKLKNLHDQLKGEKNQFIAADLSSDEEIEKLIDALPKLDGVVHCAGINTKTPIKFLNRDKINDVLNPNFYAPALLSSGMLKKRKINKGASIVMVSSISSSYTTVSNAVYSASKAALESLTRVMALELASRNIRVNSIKPGMIETELIEAYDLKEELAKFEKNIPLRRFGKTGDIANLAVFLLSEESSWITGSLITIDGGITLR